MINDSCENEKTNKQSNELQEINDQESITVAKNPKTSKKLSKSLSSTHPVSMIASIEQINNSLETKNEDLSSFSLLNNEDKNCLRRRNNNNVKKTIEFSSPVSNESSGTNLDQSKIVSSKAKLKPCFSLSELKSLASKNNKDSDSEELGTSCVDNQKPDESNMIKIMNVLNDDANELDFYDEQTCSSSYSSPSLIRSNSNNQNESSSSSTNNTNNKEKVKKSGQFYINYDCNYDYEDDFDDDDDDENELTEESDQTELCCFNDQNNNNDFTFNKKSDVIAKRKQSNSNQNDLAIKQNNEECQTTVETSSKSTPSHDVVAHKNYRNNNNKKVYLFFIKFLGKKMISIQLLGYN